MVMLRTLNFRQSHQVYRPSQRVCLARSCLPKRKHGTRISEEIKNKNLQSDTSLIVTKEGMEILLTFLVSNWLTWRKLRCSKG